MNEDTKLPALMTTTQSMSPAIQIMLDDKLFDRAKLMATYLSRAEGFTPVHLIGKTEACFAVVTRALTWKLDPFAVAQSTYSPAPGKVGYEGKLCQAIIENSGKVKGGVEYITEGDWSKVMGKFDIKTNEKSKKYPVATYTDKDEVGLKVIARAHVIGEERPREFVIELRQAWPRNSTLWATDPLTQLKYRAARGLGNLDMPGIFMGVPFEGEIENHRMKDVTPTEEERPKSNIIENINDSIKENGQSSAAVTNSNEEAATQNSEAEQSTAPENKSIEFTVIGWQKEINNASTVEEVNAKRDQGIAQHQKDNIAVNAIKATADKRIAALSKEAA